MKTEKTKLESQTEELDTPIVMPRLICHYNEREGGYLTIGKEYQAVGIDEDGWEIKDDSGDYNVYSITYLNET